MEFLEDSNYILLSNGTPTSFHAQTQNPLDICIVDLTLAPYAYWEVLEDCANSDHFPTIMELNPTNDENFTCTPYKVRNFKKANWGQFHDITTIESISLEEDIDYNNFAQVLDNAASEAIPHKTVNKTYTINNPWWNEECTLLVERRKEALINFKDNPNLHNYLRAKRLLPSQRNL